MDLTKRIFLSIIAAITMNSATAQGFLDRFSKPKPREPKWTQLDAEVWVDTDSLTKGAAGIRAINAKYISVGRAKNSPFPSDYEYTTAIFELDCKNNEYYRRVTMNHFKNGLIWDADEVRSREWTPLPNKNRIADRIAAYVCR